MDMLAKVDQNHSDTPNVPEVGKNKFELEKGSYKQI